MVPPTEKSTNNPSPGVEEVSPDLAWNSRRRMIDTGGLIVFHLSILLLFVWVIGGFDQRVALFAVPILALDLLYFSKAPDRKPILDPVPGTEKETETKTGTLRSFTLELLVLLAPPALLVSWFLFLIWNHQTLTRNELIALLIAIPVEVTLATQIIKFRLTHYHVGVKNNVSSFVAYSMMGTWVGSFFLFFPLLFCLLMKLAH